MQVAVPIKDSSEWTFLLFTSASKLIASKKECKSGSAHLQNNQGNGHSPQATNYELYKPNTVKSERKQPQKLEVNLHLFELQQQKIISQE